jgi:hypothetical protein
MPLGNTWGAALVMKVVVIFSPYTGPYSFWWVVVGSCHVSSLRDWRFLQS